MNTLPHALATSVHPGLGLNAWRHETASIRVVTCECEGSSLILRFVRVCDDAVPEVQLERRQVRQGTKHRSKQASKHVSKQVLNSP